MSLTKHLGKISNIYFGLGGYQESMLGLHTCFTFDEDSSICTSDAYWDYHTVKHSEQSKWTEQARLDKYARITCSISELLSKAKVRSVSELRNMPVEITMDGMILHSWRLIEEVL